MIRTIESHLSVLLILTGHWAVAVVWSRKNPEPWQTVGPNENIKLMSGTHKFDKR